MPDIPLSQIQHWLNDWGSWGGVLLMFLESAPLTGLLLPGIFIAIGLGVLTASQHLPLIETMLLASLGAVLGDSLGFWLGRLGSEELQKKLHKTRFQSRHQRASTYLSKFGGLGIVIGRFLWFVHPLVPPLAGTAKMPVWKFYLFDPPACLLWTVVYLGLGHWFTGVWLSKKLKNLEIISVLMFTVLVVMLLWAWNQQKKKGEQ